MDEVVVDVSAPEFYDWWRRVVARSEWDPSEASALRRVSRMFRAIVDAHALVNLDLGLPAHARAYVRSVADPGFARRFRARRAVRWPYAFRFRCAGATVGLVALHFGWSYARPLDAATLPRGLLELSFGGRFSHALRAADLPPALTLLAFGKDFAGPLTVRDLPRALRVLRLGGDYEHDVEARDLPRSLVELDLGRRFDRPFDAASLPPELRVLRFGHRFRQTVRNRDLPKGLVELALGKRLAHDDEADTLPKGLTKLRACAHLSLLEVPDGALRELRLGGSWNDRDDQLRSCVGGALRHVQHLRLGGSFDRPLKALPPGLVSLRIGGRFDHPLRLTELSCLTSLDLGNSFDRSLTFPAQLPPSLTALYLGSAFDRLINTWALPRSLTVLQVGNKFDQPLCAAGLPASLLALGLGNAFNAPLGPFSAGSKLEVLDLGASFACELLESQLPASMWTLTVSSHYRGLVDDEARPRKRTHRWIVTPFGERLRYEWP